MVDTHEPSGGSAPTIETLTAFIAQQEPNAIENLDPVEHAVFVAAFGDQDQAIPAGDFLRQQLQTAVDDYRQLRRPLFAPDEEPNFELDEYGSPTLSSAAHKVGDLLEAVGYSNPEFASEVSRLVSKDIRAKYALAPQKTREDMEEKGTVRNRMALVLNSATANQLLASCTDPVAIEDFVRSPFFKRFGNPYNELRLRHRVSQLHGLAAGEDLSENYQSMLELTRQLVATDENPGLEAMNIVGGLVTNEPEVAQRIINGLSTVAEEFFETVIDRIHTNGERTPVQQQLLDQAYEHLRGTLRGELALANTGDPDYPIEKLVEALQNTTSDQYISPYFGDAMAIVCDRLPVNRLSELVQTQPSLFASLRTLSIVSTRLASEPAYLAQALELVRVGQEEDAGNMIRGARNTIAIYATSGDDRALARAISSINTLADRLDAEESRAHDTSYAELMLELSLAAQARGNHALAEQTLEFVEQYIAHPNSVVSQESIVATYLSSGQRQAAEAAALRWLDGDRYQVSCLEEIIRQYVEHAELEDAIRLTHSLTLREDPPYDAIVRATKSIKEAQARLAALS